MSGDATADDAGRPAETIVLAAGHDSPTAAMVSALDQLNRVELGAHALIGGLAVACRLAQVHRATGDVDQLVEGTEPLAIERIVSSGVGRRDERGKLYVSGVQVDVIDTYRLSDDDLDGVEGHQRLFVVGHRYALDSSRPANVIAASTTGGLMDEAALAGAPTARCHLASAAGLVATKTHALAERRVSRPEKQASDIYDLYRLAGAHLDAIVTELRAAPFDLAELIADALSEQVMASPARAARRLRQLAGAEIERIDADALVDRFEPLVEGLRH